MLDAGPGALFALLQQYTALFDRFFTVLQLQAQFANLFVILGQQLLQALVIKLAVLRANVGAGR